ncbi:hypothetical protein [Paracoccus sp. (in: a-proteobacteria)]|uniref:hypothetical protein n=1 Tax=Paracoccus sp. TaxID=267 RepID=UPI0028A62A51|nr:hypothetical protein [Paracoccus sp. (in: a-proteobacteria)]
MTLVFAEPQYEGGRILARTGQVEVGAVFPLTDGKAMWSFWLGSRSFIHVREKSVLAAKAALMARFQDWLRFADLSAAQDRA